MQFYVKKNGRLDGCLDWRLSRLSLKPCEKNCHRPENGGYGASARYWTWTAVRLERTVIIGNKISIYPNAKVQWKYVAFNMLEQPAAGEKFVVTCILPGTFWKICPDAHEPEKYGIGQGRIHQPRKPALCHAHTALCSAGG